MPSDRTTVLGELIERLKAGDDSARWELLERAYNRLRRLAATILRQSFPRIKDQGLCQTTDLTSDARFQLARALQKVKINDVPHFFRLAAQHIRWILLDFIKRLPQHESEISQEPPTLPAVCRHEYQEVIVKLLDFVEQLPSRQQSVVYWKIYTGAGNQEIADELKVSLRAVQRYWMNARDKLGESIRNWLEDQKQTPQAG